MLRQVTLALALALASGCGSKKQEPTSLPAPSDRALLQAAYDKYLTETTSLLSPVAGWPTDRDCDAALWAGVARRAGVTEVDMLAALTPEGRPTRRPYQDCGPVSEGLAGDSGATTSSDMVLGTVLGLHAQGSVEGLTRLYDYGSSQTWVMGVPRELISRVVLKPTGIGMLAEALKDVGGEDHPLARAIPNPPLPVEADYEEHLQALSVLLQRDMGRDPGQPTTCASRLEDGLIQAVCLDLDRATQLLKDPTKYKAPSYVRAGVDHPESQQVLERVHWLLAAKLVLEASPN